MSNSVKRLSIKALAIVVVSDLIWASLLSLLIGTVAHILAGFFHAGATATTIVTFISAALTFVFALIQGGIFMVVVGIGFLGLSLFTRAIDKQRYCIQTTAPVTVDQAQVLKGYGIDVDATASGTTIFTGYLSLGDVARITALPWVQNVEPEILHEPLSPQ